MREEDEGRKHKVHKTHYETERGIQKKTEEDRETGSDGEQETRKKSIQSKAMQDEAARAVISSAH